MVECWRNEHQEARLSMEDHHLEGTEDSHTEEDHSSVYRLKNLTDSLAKEVADTAEEDLGLESEAPFREVLNPLAGEEEEWGPHWAA